MALSINDYKLQLEKKYGERRQAEFSSEWSILSKYIEAVSSRLSDTYELEAVLAVGGTGIVLRGNHKRFQRPIIVKINRPNIEPEAQSMVENEAQLLPTLNHPNIISVLDIGELKEYAPELTHVLEPLVPKLTYVVEPFIAGSRPLFTADQDRVKETWLFAKIEALHDQMPKTVSGATDDDIGEAARSVNVLLGDLAALFAQWASFLSHVHEPRPNSPGGYVYLDVKAENVLVDQHLHLTSIDYGSMEHTDSTDQSPIEVFFTERYAHPELIRRKREKASSNRVRGGLKRSELTHSFDYFALGMSMLEILNEIAAIRPHMVPQLPLFRSLHFLATRLLDGQNSDLVRDNHYQYASQVFSGLRDSDYLDLRYVSLREAHRDLEKERGRWNPEDLVPELATYSKDIVRVVPGFNTVLTPRLRRVIEHPLVARLKYVTQLGLVSLVYPTADHSRYDHALGSYTFTTYYVKSLFNDLGNPIFRNLVGAEDLNAVLLATLLHDVGQYPLAHDLEEVHDRIFKHGKIGTALLEDTAVLDERGRTLMQIINDPQNGWGVQADFLQRILGAHSRNQGLLQRTEPGSLKTDVLSSIVDGPVDADKADYITRDSVRCEIPYGSQLDLERLLRVLTVAIISDDRTGDRRVTLGVYDKGLASAHAFGQARYQLLSTVYWHHTARIVKSMLQYSTAMGLPREVFGPQTSSRTDRETQIRERLLTFVKSLVPPFQVPKEPRDPVKTDHQPALDLAAPPADVMTAIAAEAATTGGSIDTTADASGWYPGIAWTDWLMLEWIRELQASSVQSRNLITGIQTRRLYKRVASFARGGTHMALIKQLDELPWPDKVDLCTRLHEAVCSRLRRDWTNLNTVTTLGKTDFEKLAESNLLILIDIPNPGKKVGYSRPLGVVPELKEKSYYQDSSQPFEDVSWRRITEEMINGIAPVRVLCHPDVRNLVGATYAPVEASMAQELQNLL